MKVVAAPLPFREPGRRRSLTELAAACLLGFLGVGPVLGQIVINEIMYDPGAVSDANGEWIELYNAGSAAVDINGWILKDDATATEKHTINNTGGLSIASKGYLVLGRNSNTSQNGGVTVDYVYSTVNLSNSTDGVILANGSDVEQDKVVWGSANGFPDPANSASIALKGTSLDNNTGANWCTSTTPIKAGGDAGTPGAENSDCLALPAFTGEIYEIQGSGKASPYVRSSTVTTNDNIVTAVGAGGFFMQTPASSSDNDPDTSDGIFVVHAGSPTIAVGDQVDVSGTVEEYFDFTRFASGATVTVDASNQTVPAPVEFNASRPAPNPASANCALEPECYEGMRIRIASGTVSSGSQYFSSDNTAEMYVRPASGRAFREPGALYPGVSGRPSIPVWDGNPEVLELDPDKLGLTNVSWKPGATFSATGVLGYEYGGYELWPTELQQKVGGIALPRAVRAKTTGEVTVASLNLLNLRTTSPDLKFEKLSLYVRQVLKSPDVIGVQEVYQQAALTKLATQIETDDSSVDYTAHVKQTANRQAVGFLVRSGVTVATGYPKEHGAGETFVDPRDQSNDAVHDRLPIVLEASVGTFAFTVIDIHNRSFIDIDDAAKGVWVRAKRLAQAQSVAKLVQQEADKGSKVIVVGDYNDYEFTDGFVDVVAQIKGNPKTSRSVLTGPDLVEPNLCNLVDGVAASDRYSYIYQGSAQALDHALINPAMARHVVEMQFGRGNADAAGVNRNNSNALASSDHDGFVVYLSKTDRGRSVCPVGLEDLIDDGDVSDPGGTADLSVTASSRIVAPDRVRYTLRVKNAGPEFARGVVVRTSFSAGLASLATSTAGCQEDPDGVPECTLGDIAVGRTADFRIEVDTSEVGEALLRLRASVGSRGADPGPGNDEIETEQPIAPPPAPTDLVATPLNETEIELRWRDNSSAETLFAIFQQGPGDSRMRQIGTAPPNSTSTVVNELVPNVTYRFAVEAHTGALRSERTPKATATTWTSETARCGDGDVLCLGRFQVEVAWDDGAGSAGSGMAERLTGRSGDFWFFHPANIEVVAKVLDGCAINGHYWVYAVGLTDVAVTMTVRDLRSGSPYAGVATSDVRKSWTSAAGSHFGPIIDQEAFATCDDGAAAASGAASAARPNVVSGAPLGRFGEALANGPLSSPSASHGGVPASCTSDGNSLCLQGGRYEVRANWRAGEASGDAAGVPRTADTGMFWFFSPDNVELVVKILDGCGINGHRWVAMGGLTDVGVEVAVRDTASGGAAKTYMSSEGSPFATNLDVTAFPCSAGP